MDSLFAKRIIFVGGKGGVGKTTVASATALQAAAQGKKTLLVSTDPAHSLADAFARPIGDHITRVAENLDALEIDPEREASAHIERVMASMKRFTRPDMYPEIERQMRLTQQSPGTQEAALLERIAGLIDQDAADYDLLIFDTAPTGHTLRLLTLPEAMAAWTQGMLRQTARSEQLAGVLDHLSPKAGKDIDNPMADPGANAVAGMDERTAAITRTLQHRQRLFQRVRRTLTDADQTAMLFVLTPEKLPILETQRAIKALQAEQLPVAGLIINRNLPASADGEFLAQRRQQELRYRDEINSTFSGLNKLYVPLFAADLEGIEGLRLMAAELRWDQSQR